MLTFWYSWNSWVVEIISGFLVASLVQVIPVWWFIIIAPFTLSFIYEKWLDPNGWSWKDFGQRSVGILLGLIFWQLI